MNAPAFYPRRAARKHFPQHTSAIHTKHIKRAAAIATALSHNS